MLELFFHPLASYCHKVLIALYENSTSFTPILVDLGDPASREAFAKLWPLAKFPVLRDGDKVVPEAAIIIEYLDRHHRGPTRLVPDDADLAREARLQERFYDCYVMEPMSKIVTDKLRPEGGHDPVGVEQARATLVTAYGMIETEMRNRTWALGDAFTVADCAAAPALFYAEKVQPFREEHPHIGAYLDRLRGRVSFARVLEEAEPYFKMFPG